MENLPFSSPNILVIDDVSSNLIVLTEMIRKAGYIARPVASAKQAVNAIEALLPDLILMDISMPEIDGFVFCTILKKNANTRDIPVIFISALDSIESKIKGFQAGAVDYITKPFDMDEVKLRIHTHIELYKTRHELEIYNKKLYLIINDQLRKISEKQKSIMKALAKLMAKRDNNSALHMENVGKNSKLLAMSLQMSPQYISQITNSFVEAIELAASLHDIGKMIISNNILQKKNNILPEEIELVKTHTTLGAELLEELYQLDSQNDILKLAMEIARYHHEKWDGSGYPTGISGDAIPLSARIVCVVNEYDLLINDYKKAYSHERSMEIINEISGTILDPYVVLVFNKIQYQLKK